MQRFLYSFKWSVRPTRKWRITIEQIMNYCGWHQSAQMTRNNQISWEETSKINNNPSVFHTAYCGREDDSSN